MFDLNIMTQVLELRSLQGGYPDLRLPRDIRVLRMLSSEEFLERALLRGRLAEVNLREGVVEGPGRHRLLLVCQGLILRPLGALGDHAVRGWAQVEQAAVRGLH